jgi:LysM repeat protein
LFCFTVVCGNLFLPAGLHAQLVKPDSIANPDHIKKFIVYTKTYPFINYQDNFIEWCNYSAIQPFFEKLKQTPKRKLKVLHIGDSHVQADYITGCIRNRIQEMFGYGGRGFVFPYAAAGTHSTYDYRTSCKRLWAYSRNVQMYPALDMGLSGATIHTRDTSASFRFIFAYNSIRENFTHLRIYVKQSPQSFNLKLKAFGQPDTLCISCNTDNGLPYVEVYLNKASDTLEFFMDRTDTLQKFFECYGIMIESPENKGVLYNSVGINGAGYKSMLRENLFAEQLKELKPDLLIIDLGGNDFALGRIYIDYMKSDLMTIIDKIRNVSPGTSIIITNCQDAYRRRRNVPECQVFADLTKEVAIAKKCAFYNYYNVSGNRYSMLKWFSNNLAQRDRVHLTYPGYAVKGELYLNAILNSYCMSLTRQKNDTLLISKLDSSDVKSIIDFSKIYRVDSANRTLGSQVKKDSLHTQQTYVNNGQKTYSSGSDQKGDKIYYTIRAGDNLGSIAGKFHVTVSQLQQWNNIRGTNIIAGKTLVIYKKKTSSSNTTKQGSGNITTTNPNNTNNQTKPANTNNYSKPKTHKVMAGDTLWDISKKYNVSVDQIKKVNNLKDNNLIIGTVLVIPNP